MTILTSRLLGATTLSFTLAAPFAAAQTVDNTSPADSMKMDEMVVIGRVLQQDQVNAVKTPTPIIDVPQSLSIFTSEEIITRGFTSIGQIIDYTPGVNTSQGEGHRDAIVFRGVRSTADFFIDGARDDVQYYRPLYNLEQVEILRGPNALLFGRGGTGGILNRVTKKGVLGETFLGYQAAVDTFGEFGFQADVNYALTDNAAFRINGMYENLNNHRDFYDGDRFGINPTIRYQPTSRTTFDFSYEYVNHERFVDRGIPTAAGGDGRPVEAFEDIVFADPELNFTDLEAHLIRASVQHEFADFLKGNFSVFYGDYDKVYQNFYASGFNVATPDEVTLDGYIDTTDRQNLILSGNLVGEFATGSVNHTVLFGAEYINTSSRQDRFNSFWDTTMDDNEVFTVQRPLNLRGGVGVNSSGVTTTNSFTTDLNDDTDVDIDVYSVYIQNQIEVTPWLDLVGGVRFDSFDIGVNNLDPANLEFRERTDEEFSPRGGVILKPMENMSIYASYSKSFLPRSGEQFANINGDNDALEPDTFRNLEAGIKWDPTPGLSFTAAVFQIQQRSPQVADADPSTLDVIESEIEGVEFQVQGLVTENWYVTGGFSYLDGEQVDRGGDTGLRVRELPEFMFSIWNNFQVTNEIGLGVGLTYQDESFANNSNTAILPSYVRVDAAAYYDVTDDIRLQVHVENLNNTRYFPNAHSTHQVTVGAPINARFSIVGRL